MMIRRRINILLKFCFSVSDASVSLAKFCSLRPVHVKLYSKDFDVTSMLQVDFTENASNDVVSMS